MANASYDNMWQEAMSSLSEQLHVEGVEDEELEPGVTKSAAPEVTIFQAFQHFACLYIKYIQIYKKLESCYDGMIHPQKRLHVKSVLELVIRRIIELKADLVKWNPPNSYLKMPSGPEVAFPWEYVHLDDILVDLKISPEILDLCVPHYFKENYHRQIDQRDKLVSGYMHLKHNTDNLYIADPFDVTGAAEAMSLDVAIDIIQRNERGRQGYERAALVKELREKEKQGRMYDASGAMDMDPDIAATNLQRMLKGHTSRKIAARERDNEFMFIGMSRRKDNIDIMEKELNLAYRKRKQEQAENKEAYEKALEDFKEIIMDEEGPEKREELREERTLWVTDQIAQDKFPDDLEDFYATKKKGEGEEEGAGADAGGKDKKDKGKDKKEDKKDKGKDKKDKGKKEEGPPEMPKLQGVTELTKAMQGIVKTYEGTWESRDESDNFQQKHDIELGKQVVRPGVYTEIRKQVDDMLLMNLKKIQMQIQSGGKKGKKKGKKGKKKKKGKKGKKDKKKKPLPGEKIAELKNLDTDQMLSILIESQVVVRSRPKTVQSLIGEFNYLGSIHQNADRKDEGKWDPPDPSIMQIRQAVSEYCILPNGSAELKMAIDPAKMIKSVMFYGSSGSGKTHAVEAVAHELGALLIHLSPDKLRGLFGGKNGPTKLVHMCFWVARDPTMQPCVIYIDECEQFFTGGKKSKDKDGASRFKKDLLTYKNQAIGPEHRVIIIGSTKFPENGEMKDYKGFFDKFLYFPYPDYASRCLLWKAYLEVRIYEGLKIQQEELDKSSANAKTDQQKAAIEEALKTRTREILATIDSSSLASVSEGYSAGAIAKTVKLVVTARRVALVKTRPLDPFDFLDNLAMQDYNFQDDKATFTGFTRQISGMDDRRKKIDALVAGDDGDGGKDKKGGKKK